jgi:hypothetical protein
MRRSREHAAYRATGPTGPQTLMSADGTAAKSTAALTRVFATYAAAVVAVALLALGATDALRLPDWVLPGALVVVALGAFGLVVAAYMVSRARHRPDGLARGHPGEPVAGAESPGRLRGAVRAIRTTAHALRAPADGHAPGNTRPCSRQSRAMLSGWNSSA